MATQYTHILCVCVYPYIYTCVYLCVCVCAEMHAHAPLHTVHWLLSHWQLLQLIKKSTNFCTHTFAKGESFQHSSLNVSVYFHSKYYYYIWVLKLRILLCFCCLSLNHHMSNCPGKNEWATSLKCFKTALSLHMASVDVFLSAVKWWH